VKKALAVIDAVYLHPEPASSGAARVSELHYAMATPVLLSAQGYHEAELRAAVHAAASEVRHLEEVLSTFDPTSDASLVNRSAGGSAVEVAPELAELLERSRRLEAETHGSFSILVGPLVDAWRSAAQRDTWPSSSELATVRRLVAPEVLAIDGTSIRLAQAGARIDLGGVGKGFAADRALARLRDAGARGAIVNLGGSSIAAFGDAGDGTPGWPVEVPAGAAAGSAADNPVLRLRDGALSTSEAFGRSLRVAGRRVGHILDPRSGVPISSDRVAVVRHASATTAEALSKAVLVLGEVEGLSVVSELGGEALVAERGAGCVCRGAWFEGLPCCKAAGRTRAASSARPTERYRPHDLRATRPTKDRAG
jgi:thiamine biosynthesis lipoprotein